MYAYYASLSPAALLPCQRGKRLLKSVTQDIRKQSHLLLLWYCSLAFDLSHVWKFLIYSRLYIYVCVCVCVCVRACVGAQWCPTLFNSMDCSLPGSSVHGICQAIILAWLPFPSPGDLPDPGTEPLSLVSLALAGGFFTSLISFKGFMVIFQPVCNSWEKKKILYN